MKITYANDGDRRRAVGTLPVGAIFRYGGDSSKGGAPYIVLNRTFHKTWIMKLDNGNKFEAENDKMVTRLRAVELIVEEWQS